MSVRSSAVACLDTVFDRRVFTDESPPEGFAFPYSGILDNISETAVMKGDSRTLASRRLIQIDVYQRGADEDDAVVDAARDSLDGSPADGGFRFSWQGTIRQYEPDADVVHHSLTFAVVRLTAYTPK